MSSEELLELLVYLDVMINKGLEELIFIITNRKWQLCEAVKTFLPEFCKKTYLKAQETEYFVKTEKSFWANFILIFFKNLDEIALKLRFLVTSG